MKVKSNRINTVCRFHNVNQGDETITKMMCTRYAPFINAKYNGVIDDFTEQDIKDVAEIGFKNGNFSYTAGGYGIDGVYDFQEWLLTKKGIQCTVIQTKDDTESMEWLERGYACVLGIKYNKSFVKDTKDGVINTEDYADLKGDNGHFTNVIQRITGDKKQYFLDSYFKESSIYECNLKEVFEDLDLPTKYIIF